MANLKGKTAVVTGSTSGIGLAYARAFASAGANVVINGFGAPADIEKERSAIETDFKVRAVHSPADMTKPAEIAEMIALGERTFGSVDILVNNAGVQFVSPIEEFPPEKWETIIAINLSSAFYGRSEEHKSELQSHVNLVCRLLLEEQNHSSRAPH